MIRKNCLIFFIILSNLLLFISLCYGNLFWTYYHSDFLHFELEYPAEIFQPDGSYGDIAVEYLSFSSEKASLWVEGTLNPSSLRLESIYKRKINEYKDLGADITYKDKGDSWFVISGYIEGNNIFYTKHISACADEDDNINVYFTITYPEAEKELYLPITEYLEKTFKIVMSD